MILVAGATGNVGSELVRALSAAGEKVRALSRHPHVHDEPPAGVEPVKGDLDQPETLDDALVGVDRVFTLAGFADMPGLMARMRAAGVRRAVLMTGGSAGLRRMDNAISRYMTLSENAVRESGMEWTFLRPRAFMSNSLRWRPQLDAGDVVRIPFSWRRTAFIDPYDIAAVAREALLNDGHAGRIHELTGPEALLPAEQVALLAAALGRDLRMEPMSNDDARADMEARMTPERVDAYFGFYVDNLIDESPVHPTVEEVTGRPPRHYREWAAEHAHRFADTWQRTA